MLSTRHNNNNNNNNNNLDINNLETLVVSVV